MIISFPRPTRPSVEGLRRERRVARRLWRDLHSGSPTAVLAQLRASRAASFWGLYARSLRESRRLVASSPLEARRHAAVARALAVGLESSRAHDQRPLELAARGAGVEAELNLGRPLGAERELEALADLRVGVRDPRLRSELLRIEGSIDHELGRFPFAALRFEEAFLEARFEVSPARRAHLLACRAVSFTAFDVRRALEAFELAFEELEHVTAPRLHAAVHLAAVDLALERDDRATALVELRRACETYSARKRRLSEAELLHLDWRRARVAASSSLESTATSLLEHLVRRFAATGNFRDQALATLDLVGLEGSQGRHRAAAGRIDTLATHLSILGLHEEAVCSLLALREEVGRPTRARTNLSSDEAVREVRRYLLGWWWLPKHWELRAPSALPPVGIVAPLTRTPLSPIPSVSSSVGTDAEAYHAFGGSSAPPAVWSTDLSA